MAEKLATALRDFHDPVLIRHNGLGDHTIHGV
jgi:hypothetical protein